MNCSRDPGIGTQDRGESLSGSGENFVDGNQLDVSQLANWHQGEGTDCDWGRGWATWTLTCKSGSQLALGFRSGFFNKKSFSGDFPDPRDQTCLAASE